MAMPRMGKILIASWVTMYAVLVLLFLQATFNSPISFITRFFALTGIVSLFNATFLSAFLRDVTRVLGKPFIKIHHVFAILGTALITTHPVVLAINFMNPTVFIPSFESWLAFWRLAGRPALILIWIALVAVLLKRLLKRSWRALHALNYIALTFGVVHGLLLVGSRQNVVIAIIYVALLGFSFFTFTYKRYLKIKQSKLATS